MPNEITVAAIQITADDRDKPGTVDRVMRLIDQAGDRGAELTVLPEVWTGLGASG